VAGDNWSMPTHSDNEQFFCARVRRRLIDMGYGSQLAWEEKIEHEAELVLTKKAGHAHDTIIRVTVSGLGGHAKAGNLSTERAIFLAPPLKPCQRCSGCRVYHSTDPFLIVESTEQVEFRPLSHSLHGDFHGLTLLCSTANATLILSKALDIGP